MSLNHDISLIYHFYRKIKRVSAFTSLAAHWAMADVSRVRILDELRTQDPFDAREFGRRAGLRPNTIRSRVDRSIEAGRARSIPASPAGHGRPRILFAATTDAKPLWDGDYKRLVQVLAKCLSGADRPEVIVKGAGRAWAKMSDRESSDLRERVRRGSDGAGGPPPRRAWLPA